MHKSGLTKAGWAYVDEKSLVYKIQLFVNK